MTHIARKNKSLVLTSRGFNRFPSNNRYFKPVSAKDGKLSTNSRLKIREIGVHLVSGALGGPGLDGIVVRIGAGEVVFFLCVLQQGR